MSKKQRLKNAVKEPEVLKSEDNCGVVYNCARLNVREAPSIDAEILYEINQGTEVLINENESTDTFYKICTSSGFEGFCMKQYIQMKG